MLQPRAPTSLGQRRGQAARTGCRTGPRQGRGRHPGPGSIRRITGSLKLPFRPHRICGGADFLRGHQVVDAAVDCTGIVGVAGSFGRSKSDDLP